MMKYNHHMKKNLLSIVIFVAYCVILIKVMVFKDIPAIKLGSLMLNFGGTDSGHPANFIPFKTIVSYLLGYKGWIIAGINLVGNIALLVPIGFLIPFVCRKMTWKRTLLLAVVAGPVIEILQVVLRVGIFDIDDVILNALGVIIGYLMFTVLAHWIRLRKYKTIIIAAIIVVAAAGAFYSRIIYPITHQSINPNIKVEDISSEQSTNEEGSVPQSGDPCGGTGGIGQITTLGNKSFTIKRTNNVTTIINLTDQTTITTSSGSGSASNLKVGDRVTLVGGPNPDGSFSAEAVFICAPINSVQ
jgi:glycopeptide antibiotics resistance protein